MFVWYSENRYKVFCDLWVIAKIVASSQGVCDSDSALAVWIKSVWVFSRLFKCIIRF